MEGEYLAGAPRIAVEVLSEGNSAAAIQRKIGLYLGNGARQAIEVWLIDARHRSITVYANHTIGITMESHTSSFRSRCGDIEIDPDRIFI